MPPKGPSSKGEYIETETGNKISRKAMILGTKHIMLAGKCVIQENVVIHGDLVRPPSQQPSQQQKGLDGKDGGKSTSSSSSPQEATSVHLGRYVFISQGCTLHPPSRMSSSSSSSSSSTAGPPMTPALVYYPLRIADHVYIGPNTVIRAAEIKSNVYIGANCTIGSMVIIKDNVKVLDGSVLPANSVWASGSVIAGSPARVVGELGEAWGGSGAGGGGGGSGGFNEEGVGLRSRERWASVGNKK